MRRVGAIGLALAALLSACSSLDDVINTTAQPAITTQPVEATTSTSTTVAETTTSTTETEPETTVAPTTAPLAPPVFSGALAVEVLNTYPHDTAAYTESLEFDLGSLIETTGLFGSSTRRQVDPESGSTTQLVELDPDLWGTGLTFIGETGFQVTRQRGLVILFNQSDLSEFDRFTFEGEGWGLCATDELLYLSSGGSTLSVRDPMSFLETASVSVTRDGTPAERLGELECVGNQIWAVLWPTNTMVQFDQSGVVTATADLSSLVPEGLSSEDTLAGIAYNDATGTFFVTGKRWPNVFELKLSNG